MRKWMRDRLRRRKPKDEAAPGTPQPAPLQPSYPEEAEPATPEPEFKEPEPAPAVEPEAAAKGRAPASGPDSRRGGRGRRRRKRGGGGGGGAPRERAPRGPVEAPLRPAYDLTEAGRPKPPSAHIAPELKPAQAAGSRPSRTPRGVVVLAIGLPGSGKSSWFKRRGVNPLSSDMLRTILFDDITQQRYQDLVFSTLRALLRARLIAHMPWNYVDATNLSPNERRGWIKMSRDYGYEVHAVFFDVPLEICMERNNRRNRGVPEDVMQRMASKLRPPTFEEGFSKITVVRVKRAAASAASEAGEPEAEQEQES